MKKDKKVNLKELVNYIEIEHSSHSKIRASQRGITKKQLTTAILCSKSFFKQGLIYYVVQTCQLKDIEDANLKKSIKNLVVIIAQDSNKIITCYKNNKGMNHIKRKGKILYNNEEAA